MGCPVEQDRGEFVTLGLGADESALALYRKDYKQEELDHADTAVNQQIAAYKKLVKAIGSATSDAKVASALEAFNRSSSTT